MKLPILTFHDFGDSHSLLRYSSATLRDGLVRLLERGYRTIGLLEAVRAWRAGEPLPERRFVITIDDGYESVYSEAFPILGELDLTATVFVAVGRGRAEGRSGRLESLEGRRMLNWAQVEELAGAGFTIGAHTLTHPDLTTLPREDARREIVESGDALEDRLGRAVETFAYPFGFYDETIRRIVAGRYECACSDALGLAGPRSDPYALERVEMYYFHNPGLFGTIGGPIGTAYLAARAGPRNARRRWARRHAR